MTTAATIQKRAEEALKQIAEQKLATTEKQDQENPAYSNSLEDQLHGAICDALEDISMILGVVGYADKTEEREIGVFEMRGIISALERTYDRLTEANLRYMNSK